MFNYWNTSIINWILISTRRIYQLLSSIFKGIKFPWQLKNLLFKGVGCGELQGYVYRKSHCVSINFQLLRISFPVERYISAAGYTHRNSKLFPLSLLRISMTENTTKRNLTNKRKFSRLSSHDNKFFSRVSSLFQLNFEYFSAADESPLFQNDVALT